MASWWRSGVVLPALTVRSRPGAARLDGVNPTMQDADTVAINTVRGLCMDAIQRANSGHPGTPLGMAPVAYTQWQRFLRFDPADPIYVPDGVRNTFAAGILARGRAARDEWEKVFERYRK